MKNSQINFFWASAGAALLLSGQSAFALDGIIRTFDSARAHGMGNVRYTTGLYEENFFANPARTTQNPKSRFQLPQFTVGAGSGTLNSLSSLTSGSSGSLNQVADAVGTPLSAKVQLVFPAYYSREFIMNKWAFGVGLVIDAKTQGNISQNGTIDPTTLINAGPVISIARRLLAEDRLSIGMNIHTEFRASVNREINITEFLSGTQLTGSQLGGNGIGLDADLGTSFRPYWTWLNAQYEIGFAINNILGGNYKNLSRPIKTWINDPIQTPRTYNFGISGVKKKVWIFDQLLMAFEVTDIGNNRNGSVFRLLHFGSEAKWRSLAFRAGTNQGYLTAGFGVSVGFFDLNLATYGEEMGLNAGTREDRRYLLEFGFQI